MSASNGRRPAGTSSPRVPRDLNVQAVSVSPAKEKAETLHPWIPVVLKVMASRKGPETSLTGMAAPFSRTQHICTHLMTPRHSVRQHSSEWTIAWALAALTQGLWRGARGPKIHSLVPLTCKLNQCPSVGQNPELGCTYQSNVWPSDSPGTLTAEFAVSWVQRGPAFEGVFGTGLIETPGLLKKNPNRLNHQFASHFSINSFLELKDILSWIFFLKNPKFPQGQAIWPGTLVTRE